MPELALRLMLHGPGNRFTVNVPNNKRLPGRPDLVLPWYRTVVFVHGLLEMKRRCGSKDGTW